MWLSNEQEFWDVFEDRSVQLQPSGLQQVHFPECLCYFNANTEVNNPLLLAAYSRYALHRWDCCLWAFSTQTSSAACVNNHNQSDCCFLSKECWPTKVRDYNIISMMFVRLSVCPVLNITFLLPLKFISAHFLRTSGFLKLPRVQFTSSCWGPLDPSPSLSPNLKNMLLCMMRYPILMRASQLHQRQGLKIRSLLRTMMTLRVLFTSLILKLSCWNIVVPVDVVILIISFIIWYTYRNLEPGNTIALKKKRTLKHQR